MGDVTEFVEPEARPLLAIEDLSKALPCTPPIVACVAASTFR